MSDEEEWRPVVGFETFYEVSDQGRVRSLDRVVARRTKAGPNGSIKRVKPAGDGIRQLRVDEAGGLVVNLCWGNRAHTKRVHCLVLEAFVGPCPAGMKACHRDDVRTNNHISNLYWGPRATILSSTSVLEIRQRAREGMSRRKIAAAFSVSTSVVQNVITRHTWKHVTDNEEAA